MTYSWLKGRIFRLFLLKVFYQPLLNRVNRHPIPCISVTRGNTNVRNCLLLYSLASCSLGILFAHLRLAMHLVRLAVIIFI